MNSHQVVFWLLWGAGWIVTPQDVAYRLVRHVVTQIGEGAAS